MSHTGASGRGTRFGMGWVWQTLGRQFSLGLVTGFARLPAVVGFGYLMAVIYLLTARGTTRRSNHALGTQFSLGLVTGFGGKTAVVGFGYRMALI